MDKKRARTLKALEIDSDKRFRNSQILAAGVGISLGFYITALEFAIPAPLVFPAESEVVVCWLPTAPPQKAVAPDFSRPELPAKKFGSGGELKGKGLPDKMASKGVLELITSKSHSNPLLAYDLLQAKATHDVVKVLDNVAALTRTGQTRLSGRPGRIKTEFNPGYASGPESAVDSLLANLVGGPPGSVSLQAKGVIAPGGSDITFAKGAIKRSTASILAVIRQHSPGLRHIYNQYLKQYPGLSGKVRVTFTIAPSGRIVGLDITGSTMGIADFEQAIREKILNWRFEPMGGIGNDIVTVPFTFSE